MAKPYEVDLPLFEKLGFKPFDGELAEWTKVGERQGIKVFVLALPAQFWTAHIGGMTVSTGSGTLSYYWPLFEAIAKGDFNDPRVVEAINDGMLVVELDPPADPPRNPPESAGEA